MQKKKILNFYKNKNILITGHTGFKGSWLSAWLSLFNANLYGLSEKNNYNDLHYKLLNISFCKQYFFNISNKKKLLNVIKKINPKVVFHLAAQPLVINSYEKPYDTFISNTLGLLNLLDCLKSLNKECVVVVITSDKVYLNNDNKKKFIETDTLGGIDPYSASKACGELIFKSYFDSFLKNSKIKISIARAGNVIGGGDWSKNRIIPDAFKSWNNFKPLKIRNPHSTRPWQHVLDPLSGYIILGYILNKNKKINGEAFNFGPNYKTDVNVSKLIKMLGNNYKYSKVKIIKTKVNSKHESKFLGLNCTKAKKLLKWNSSLNFTKTILWTREWYFNYDKNKKNIKNITFSQINEFMKSSNIFND